MSTIVFIDFTFTDELHPSYVQRYYAQTVSYNCHVLRCSLLLDSVLICLEKVPP